MLSSYLMMNFLQMKNNTLKNTSQEYREQSLFNEQESRRVLGINHYKGQRTPKRDSALFVVVEQAFGLLQVVERSEWEKIVRSPLPVYSDQSASSFSPSPPGQTPQHGGSFLSLEMSFDDSFSDSSVHSILPEQQFVIAQAILKHGQCTADTYNYFLKLDPKRCCAPIKKISPADQTNTVSHFQCVPNISKGPETDKKKGKVTKQKNTKMKIKPDKILSPKEELIYKHALLCAQYPVLCFPVPVKSSESRNRFSREDDAVYNFIRRRNSVLSPTDSIAIEREALYAIMRRAFAIGSRLHNQYEQDVIRSIPGRDPSKALLIELINQLNQLESNSNLFYSPSVFENLDVYQEWRSMKIDSVKSLINARWPENDLIQAQKISRFNAHEEYTVILTKLLQ